MLYDESDLINEIFTTLMNKPHLLQKGSKERGKFFKARGWEPEKGEELMAKIEAEKPGVISQHLSNLPTDKSNSMPGKGQSAKTGSKRSYDQYSLYSITGDEYNKVQRQKRAQNIAKYGLHTPANTAERTSPFTLSSPSAPSQQSVDRLSLPQKFAKSLSVMLQLSLRSFPPQVRNQGASWSYDNLGTTGILSNFYESYKEHKSYVQAPPISADLEELQANLQAVNDDRQSLLRERDSTQEHIIELTSKHAASLEEVKRLQHRVEESKTEFEDARAKITSLEESLNQTQSKLLQKETVALQHYRALETAMQETHDANDSLEEMQAKYEDAIQKVELLSSKLSSSEQTFQQEAERAESQYTLILQLQGSLDTAKEQLLTASEELARVQQQVDTNVNLDTLTENIRSELLTSNELRLKIRDEILVEQARDACIAEEQAAQRRSDASRKGWHTRTCRNNACRLTGCIKRRERAQGAHRELRNREALRLRSTLDGTFWR